MKARALVMLLTLFPVPSLAANLTARFDAPAASRTVANPSGELKCTWYRDLMVRETGTDTPSPDPPILVPLRGKRPPCSTAREPHAIQLKRPGFRFDGRKGPFLIFSEADPNGAIAFAVVDASSGRTLYTDATAADRGIRLVAVKHGVLRMWFTRGVNADCSLIEDAAACWSKLIAEGRIPPTMAGAAPSRRSCIASYKAANAGSNDPSVVTYSVDVTIDRTGKALLRRRGTVGCEAMP